MDDVLSFRNSMAESGIEYTPSEAKNAMEATIEFQQIIDQQVIENPAYFDNLRSMTFADKQAICEQLQEDGNEMTVKELTDIIDLILFARDRELDDWQK